MVKSPVTDIALYQVRLFYIQATLSPHRMDNRGFGEFTRFFKASAGGRSTKDLTTKIAMYFNGDLIGVRSFAKQTWQITRKCVSYIKNTSQKL